MSENVSPNRIPRKLKQTKLVFTKNNGIRLDSNPIKKKSNPPMSTKRLKVEDQQIDVSDDECQCVELPVQHMPEVDPQLQDIAVEDNTDNELPLEIKLRLIEDCSENNPTVKALKTRDQLKEECISLGLVLGEEICYDCSDEKPEELITDSKGGSFEVESIYDSRKESDRMTYSVKWKNWSEESNSWEPLTHLMNCRKLVEEFNHFKSNYCHQMDVYRNYYKLKGIIEDVVERKIPFNVMTSVLLVFNDIRLKDFGYTKSSVNKLRNKLRDTHLSEIDKISGVEKTDKRVEQLTAHYNRLIDDLNISKRFDSFEKFFDYFVKRKQLEFRLNRWETDINDIIIEQKEGQTIRVENFVDCEVPPPGFEYISNCKTIDPNIIISDDPPLFCVSQCDDCESQRSGCCVASYGSISYTKNGILKDSRNNRNAIYECNKKCKCSQNCINRVVQKGRKHKLAIFRTDDGKGWGVRALEPIPKGSYVMEYVGEIISVCEADKRGHIYDAEGRTYLFDLDFTPDEIAKYTLDATQCGNVSHFVNHSCDPNLDTKVVWINNLDAFMPHIALFAVRNIKLNEELTFDYKINVHGITDADNSQDLNQKDLTTSSDKSYDSGIDGSTFEPKPMRVSCQCGAYNCRKFLY